jgi:hypothetical protein
MWAFAPSANRFFSQTYIFANPTAAQTNPNKPATIRTK